MQDERKALIGELDPNAEPIPEEIANLEREFAEADRAAGLPSMSRRPPFTSQNCFLSARST